MSGIQRSARHTTIHPRSVRDLFGKNSNQFHIAAPERVSAMSMLAHCSIMNMQEVQLAIDWVVATNQRSGRSHCRPTSSALAGPEHRCTAHVVDGSQLSEMHPSIAAMKFGKVTDLPLELGS